MGILNITFNSFYDGEVQSKKAALKRANQIEEEGADILDIGSESSSPSSKPISSKEELKRILPILKSLETNITILIDTYKPKVAKKSLKNGASIINDIYGLRYDQKMAEVISD